MNIYCDDKTAVVFNVCNFTDTFFISLYCSCEWTVVSD